MSQIASVDTGLSDRINAAGIKTFSNLEMTRVELRFPNGAVLEKEVPAGQRVDISALWVEGLGLLEGDMQ